MAQDTGLGSRHTHTQTGRQADRQTGRQTDRQTEIHEQVVGTAEDVRGGGRQRK